MRVAVKPEQPNIEDDLKKLEVGRRYTDLQRGLLVLGILITLGVLLQQCS